jgi:hypothetical protein
MAAVLDERMLETILDEPVAWPNLSQAATITGLSKGTLSKQAQASRITTELRGFGHAERVLPPREVLRIGSAYRRVPQDALIERLTTFLAERLHVDTRLVQRVLRALVETTAFDDSEPGPGGTGSGDEHVEPPGWLTEVERLREHPEALAGTLSFTSPDDVIGTIELGRSVDAPSETDLAAWNVTC